MTDNVQKIAFYPGCFDPVTNGHIDIIRRSLKIFDKIFIGIGDSLSKKPFFSKKDRVFMLESSVKEFQDVEIIEYSGLTVKYAKSIKASAIIRGLRNEKDFSLEQNYFQANYNLESSIETIFIPCASDYLHISSSLVKEIFLNGGDISFFVPPIVREKFADNIL